MSISISIDRHLYNLHLDQASSLVDLSTFTLLGNLENDNCEHYPLV